MRNPKRKIIAGAVFFACGVIAIAGGSAIAKKADSIPVSAIGLTDETPVIVLDAGHGEST